MRRLVKLTSIFTFALLAIMNSLSASALSHSCNVGIVDPPGSEYWPKTIYHRSDFTTGDAVFGLLEAYGYVSSPVSQSGTDYVYFNGEGSYIQYFPSPYPAYFSWGGQSALYNDDPYYFVSSTSLCSNSVTFSAPSVNAYSIPSSGVVVQGDQVTLGFTASAGDGNSCYFLGSPVGTSSSSTFTAQLSDAGSYTIDCENYFDQASDTVNLTVLECGNNYTRQIGPSSSSPSTSYVSGQLIIGGQKLFGHTEMNWDYGSLSPAGLSCALECISNEEKWIIKGNIVVSSGSYEKVAEQVQADGCSGVLTRSSTNKAITATHENIHGEAFVPHINAGNLSIHYGAYDTLGSCSTAAVAVLTAMDTALSAEDADQASHSDHDGEPIQAIACVNNQTVEGTSGTY